MAPESIMMQKKNSFIKETGSMISNTEREKNQMSFTFIKLSTTQIYWNQKK